MRILILTGKFGMGHWSASQSLAVELQNPACEVVVEDFLAFALPNLSDTLYRTFNLLVTHGSPIFNAYYKLTSRGNTDSRPIFEGVLLDKLVELLAEHQPDLVIATHPLCAQLISRLRATEGLDIPLVTCVTDITTHPEWVNRGTDCYLVPSEEVKQSLCARGIENRRILVTGIPVAPVYHQLSRRSGGEGRNLLLMGGGLGLLPKKSSFYEALNALDGVHTTVITGRNEKLYEKLVGKYPNINVVGFVSNVSDYMAQADLIVTKPGGITLFETIFARLPILTWPPQLQQERTNAKWLSDAGIGWVAQDMDCADEIARIITDDTALTEASARMEHMRDELETESLQKLLQAVALRVEVSA